MQKILSIIFIFATYKTENCQFRILLPMSGVKKINKLERIIQEKNKLEKRKFLKIRGWLVSLNHQ